jgi:hypothetical protein
MSRGTQTNAAILPTVGCPAEDIITLGGYPPPTSSHLPCPSPPHGTAGSLTEMSGQIGEAHHVLHHLGNLLVPLVPWGMEVDVHIAKEEGDMPVRAFVPGLLDCRQRAEVVWWDVAPHSKKLVTARNQHKCQHVRPPYPPVLNHVRFVGLPEEGNPTLVRAGGVRRDDRISTQISSVNSVCHLDFHQDPEVSTYALHRPQSGLQSSITTIADVVRRNRN